MMPDTDTCTFQESRQFVNQNVSRNMCSGDSMKVCPPNVDRGAGGLEWDLRE